MFTLSFFCLFGKIKEKEENHTAEISRLGLQPKGEFLFISRLKKMEIEVISQWKPWFLLVLLWNCSKTGFLQNRRFVWKITAVRYHFCLPLGLLSTSEISLYPYNWFLKSLNGCIFTVYIMYCAQLYVFLFYPYYLGLKLGWCAWWGVVFPSILITQMIIL